MGFAIDTITCFKDSLTGGSPEALTVASGDSLSLRFLDPNCDIKLVEAWGGDNATKCEFQIRSPLLHDNTRGIVFASMFNPTLSGADGNPQIYMGAYETQKYYPSDTLIVEANGTASDDVTISQLITYEGAGVHQQSLISPTDLRTRGVNLIGLRCSPSAHATTSTYGTAEAINTDDTRLKANREYAIIGCTLDLPVTTIAITAPETNNLKISMPGSWNERVTASWFLDLSERFGRPMIPVINANNAPNVFLQVADAGGGTTPRVDLKLVELSGTTYY